jgi:hypothetical protein
MDFSNSIVQVLLFFIFILVLLFINKYFFNTENSIVASDTSNINNTSNSNKIRCVEEEDPLTSNNKNDLRIVNNTFKVYDENTKTNDDLVNELLPKYNEFKKPTNELEAQFINNNIVYDSNKDNGKCNIKAEKTDLPIVNIKVCNLTNKSSMKLSEYI